MRPSQNPRPSTLWASSASALTSAGRTLPPTARPSSVTATTTGSPTLARPQMIPGSAPKTPNRPSSACSPWCFPRDSGEGHTLTTAPLGQSAVDRHVNGSRAFVCESEHHSAARLKQQRHRKRQIDCLLRPDIDNIETPLRRPRGVASSDVAPSKSAPTRREVVQQDRSDLKCLTRWDTTGPVPKRINVNLTEIHVSR